MKKILVNELKDKILLIDNYTGKSREKYYLKCNGEINISEGCGCILLGKIIPGWTVVNKGEFYFTIKGWESKLFRAWGYLVLDSSETRNLEKILDIRLIEKWKFLAEKNDK